MIYDGKKILGPFFEDLLPIVHVGCCFHFLLIGARCFMTYPLVI